MTLIDYFNQFWEADEEKHFTQAETRLYFYLLYLWNATGRKDWFECKTSMIEHYADINPMTLTRCRKSLKSKGLIDFKQGVSKSKYPYYSIINVKDDVKVNVKDNVKVDVKDDVNLHRVKREREKEIISKDITKKERDFAYMLPGFIPIMKEWLDYKQKRKENYKTDASIRKCYQNLIKLSNNNSSIAQLIIDQSIANNWAGLFELKYGEQVQRNAYTSKQEANQYAFNQFVEYREARESGLLDEMEKPF